MVSLHCGIWMIGVGGSVVYSARAQNFSSRPQLPFSLSFMCLCFYFEPFNCKACPCSTTVGNSVQLNDIVLNSLVPFL